MVVGAVLSAGPAAREATHAVGLAADARIILTGHGHGHGRGMGQWGAYGYAKQGWPAAVILRHFYGGTTLGTVNQPITVGLSVTGPLAVRANAGARVGGQLVSPGQAVAITGRTATITAGCGGAVIRTIAASFVDPINPAPGRPRNELLTLCRSGAAYRGSLGIDGSRVVNKLSIDDYVKGVIPKESVPAWGDSGGMEALKAQAVVARSYALAAVSGGKQIDDTQNSQVYGGAGAEDPRTNRAADATAGQILRQHGVPALTEFSASTGGYTAGGRFPAVLDAGDVLSPDHNWTASVSASSIAAAFGVGVLRGFEVIEANGLGPNNGRAVKVRVSGSARTVEVSGEDVRTKLQLKSSWFAVNGQRSKPKIVSPPTGSSADPLGSLGLGALSLGSSALGSSGLDSLGFGSLDAGSLAALADSVVPGAAQLLAAATDAFGKLGSLKEIIGPLGQAIAAPTLTPDARGVTQRFRRGMMFFSQRTGAHVLAGRAFADYQRRGGIPVLGFPRANRLR
ncbi:MAG: SpoIID/LytB domain-containing protein [Gordonia sp. (in: high G+C Gram-positive bacteria)]